MENRSEARGAVDLEQEAGDLRRRLVRLIADGRKSELGADMLSLDPSVYTDPDRFEAERREIFAREPMLVGLSDELREPGDRILFDLAGPPVLVIRGRDGVLRAFLNMCTHRGARLVSDCEPTKRLLCPFHGWAYDLDGRLAGLPLTRAFEGLDEKKRGLVRVPVAEWNGMVFVRARPGEEALELEGFLGPIAPLFAALDFGSLRRVRSSRIEARCNWKLALDMGRETYHVPVVHRKSLARNLEAHVTVFDRYGLHNRFAGADRGLAGLVGKPESEWPECDYQAVHYLFPNTTLSFTHAVDGETPIMTMSRVYPGGSVGRSVTELSIHARGERSEAADAAIGAIHDAVVEIVRGEDYAVAESVWRSIEHGRPGIPFVLGRNELLVQQTHRLVADRIGMPLP